MIKKQEDILVKRDIDFINNIIYPDKYKEFTIDLYTHNALDQETFDDIKNNYSKDKRKDDFER